MVYPDTNALFCLSTPSFYDRHLLVSKSAEQDKRITFPQATMHLSLSIIAFCSAIGSINALFIPTKAVKQIANVSDPCPEDSQSGF